jgi:hypothetical protein
MDIIVLEGPNRSGKTSALGMLYALMANTPQSGILYPPALISKGGAKDFMVALNYAGKRQGQKKIAIFTSGDTTARVQEGILYATAVKADILIAANSSGKPSSALYAPHTIQHTVPKIPSTPLPVNNAVNAINPSFHAACLAANMQTAQTIEALL